MRLIEKIKDRSARVAIIGLGYVGIPLMCRVVEAGFRVVGLDIDEEKLRVLANGRSPLTSVTDAQIQQTQGYVEYTTTYERLQTCDLTVVCVPTPLKYHAPDLSILLGVIERLAFNIPDNHLVIVESTIYPGVTEDLVLPLLEKGGKKVGETLHLAHSPERVDPLNSKYDVHNTPKLMSGVTEAGTAVAKAFYETVIDHVVPVSSPRVAEAAKMLENSYRLVNISLVNELALLCHEIGISVWEVIEAASTKPYGYNAFYPGLGAGGHCIPVDPLYLAWKAREHNVPMNMVERAKDINNYMPIYAVQRVMELLNEQGKALRGSDVLVLGIAYKPGVADVRESPALPLLEELRRKGANVTYHDPHVPSVRLSYGTQESIADLNAGIAKADIVIIATTHSQYNWEEIVSHAKQVFDGRGATRRLNAPNVAVF